jgi:hypothetical protein
VLRLHPDTDPLARRLVWSDADAPAPDAPAASAPPALRLLEPGLATLHTARTRAVLGELHLRPAVSAAPGFTVASPAPFEVVAATSLDAEPLERAGRMLLFVAARVENTGQSFRPFRRGLVALGTAPMLAEPVRGGLTLTRTDTRPLRLVPLDQHGRRAGPGTVYPVSDDGTVTLPLDAQPALWFELSVEP